MHDYQAVEAIVRRLTEAGLGDVAEVRIQAGPAFSPVALQQAYEMVTLGTPLAASCLRVEGVEGVEGVDEACACPACGLAWHVSCEDVAGYVVVCPACGAPTSIAGLTSL